MSHETDCECHSCRHGIEAARLQLDDMVTRYGWAGQGVGGGGGRPGFTYTVGLAGKRVPDLVLIGIGMRTAMDLFHVVVPRLLAGEIRPGVPVDGIAEGFATIFAPLPTDRASDFASAAWNWARARGASPRFWQMCYPDPVGAWPWEVRCTDPTALVQRMIVDWRVEGAPTREATAARLQ